LLLNGSNPRQTFNFIENDVRRLGRNVKTDLELHKRRHKKTMRRAQIDQFKLCPWNLEEEEENK
jgi:hypothetical protein